MCLICHTTFTRQHSLNYHMLIHNNQSRFTCKDCGRKFRHPSHFKVNNSTRKSKSLGLCKPFNFSQYYILIHQTFMTQNNVFTFSFHGIMCFRNICVGTRVKRLSTALTAHSDSKREIHINDTLKLDMENFSLQKALNWSTHHRNITYRFQLLKATK